ncbi:MAG: DUF427 domain-containing protein [Anaerolineae bacterium]|nr:DUF427 domain-containing protein [Anaerolineae bacterium]
MVQAVWNDAIIAKSDKTIIVEGNHYFPPESVNMEYIQSSSSHTRCPWKGIASYYDVVVDGKMNQDAAWYYASPSNAANLIKGHIAFWRGVRVVETTEEIDLPVG